jgi:glyceraldehyde-3-phosphate dehydrogenase/erythrose-4-phosphate dehydrogenase
MKGIIGIAAKEPVSSDFRDIPCSAVMDALRTG